VFRVGNAGQPRAFQPGRLELEKRHRGSEEEITERISTYLPYLQGKGEVRSEAAERAGESEKVEGGRPAYEPSSGASRSIVSQS
jgi:hypothetical protein